MLFLALVLFFSTTVSSSTVVDSTVRPVPTVVRKFLCYSPQASRSHVNYLAKLTDTLVDAGHEVVYLSPVLDRNIRGPGTKKARLIELPQDEEKEYEKSGDSSLLTDVWKAKGWWEVDWSRFEDLWVKTCNTTINHPGLIEQLRAEKFDAAFGESIDWCFAGILHLAGIDNFALTESLALKDAFFAVHQTPNLPSYVPTLTSGNYGEDMTFLQRAANLFYFLDLQHYHYRTVPKYQRVFEQKQSGFPDLIDLAAKSSLVFLNSDPLVDFPHPSSARMIDVGGIAVSHGHRQLNETWSSILDLRPRTVLFSFGTFAKAHGMPASYRRTVIETIKKFPDVTFIWKYEKPEHRVSAGVTNLIEVTWMPQSDILHDPRLTAFITHGGQGSISEANYAGVPLVVIPIIFDQARNAYQAKRNKLGLVVHKTDLATEGPLEEAIREVLENPEYGKQAKRTAKMLAEKPFSAREVFVRNMEFLAAHGPLRQLDHYGRHLSFVQYYLIDVIGLAIVLFTVVVSVVVFVIYKIVRICARMSKRKME